MSAHSPAACDTRTPLGVKNFRSLLFRWRLLLPLPPFGCSSEWNFNMCAFSVFLCVYSFPNLQQPATSQEKPLIARQRPSI
jgi:hypothetical protein